MSQPARRHRLGPPNNNVETERDHDQRGGYERPPRDHARLIPLYIHKIDSESHYREAGRTLDDALPAALTALRHDGPAAARRLKTSHGRAAEAVLLIATSRDTVLLIGRCPLADEARALLGAADGIAGWRRHDVTGVTSLEWLRPKIPTRAFNSVVRAGFTSVEQAATVPPASWLRLHGFGHGFVRALRLALAELDESVPTSEPVIGIHRRRDQHLNRHLSVSTRGRYRDLAAGLVASDIPLDQLAQVARSLDEEILPQADLTVLRLLADWPELHRRYSSTHRTESQDEVHSEAAVLRTDDPCDDSTTFRDSWLMRGGQ